MHELSSGFIHSNGEIDMKNRMVILKLSLIVAAWVLVALFSACSSTDTAPTDGDMAPDGDVDSDLNADGDMVPDVPPDGDADAEADGDAEIGEQERDVESDADDNALPEGCEAALVDGASPDKCTQRDEALCQFVQDNPDVMFDWILDLDGSYVNEDGIVDYYDDDAQQARADCLLAYLAQRGAGGRSLFHGSTISGVHASFNMIGRVLAMTIVKTAWPICTDSSVCDCEARSLETCTDHPFCRTIGGKRADETGTCSSEEALGCVNVEIEYFCDGDYRYDDEGRCWQFMTDCPPQRESWRQGDENCSDVSFPSTPCP
jgi:hypothetical protein